MNTTEVSVNGSFSFSEKDEKGKGIPDRTFINLLYFAFGGIGISLVCVVGFVLNFLSVVVFSRFEKRTPSVFLLICLAVADNANILATVFNFSVPAMYPYTGWFKDYFFFRTAHTRLLFGLKNCLFVIPPWLVVLVTFDRYLHLCSGNALRSEPTASIKAWALRVGGVVLFACLIDVPRYFLGSLPERPCPLNTTSPVSCLGAPYLVSEYHKAYGVFTYVFVHFFVPFLIVLVLNVKMTHYMAVLAKDPTMIGMHKLGVHRTFIKMTFVIAVTTMAASLTVSLSILFGFFGNQRIGKKRGMLFIYPVVIMVSALSSCFNFFIYGLFGKQFRRTLKSLCCHRKPKKEGQAAHAVTERKRNAKMEEPKPKVSAISTIGSV